MMRTIFLLCMFICLNAQAQKMDKAIVTTTDNQTLKIENVIVDSYTEQISYIGNNGELHDIAFDNIESIKMKTGSYWLIGLLSGFGSGLIVSAATAPDDGEWWHGAGPKILVGAGVGGIVGTLIPKYREVKLSPQTSFSLLGNGIRLTF